MSQILWVNWRDLVKGLIVAVFTAALTTIYGMLTQQVEIDLKQVGIIALTAMVGYLLKQFGTDTNGKFIGKL